MSEYSHCSICGGSFSGIGNVCPGCEHALSREPLEIRQVERQTRNNSEPLRDIISEARGVFKELLKHGYAVVSVDRMADIIDRVEEAHKREREAGAEAAQICGEIGEMVGRAASKNQSVTNCNRLGNSAKMRDALENIAEYAKAAACHTEDAHLLGYLNQIERWVEAALSAPQRNCDVGTPEEVVK